MFTDAILQHAIALAARGWCVLPRQTREKKPLSTDHPCLALSDTGGGR